jgi:hypothetical protein
MADIVSHFLRKPIYLEKDGASTPLTERPSQTKKNAASANPRDKRLWKIGAASVFGGLLISLLKREVHTVYQAIALCLAVWGPILEGPFVGRAIKLKTHVNWMPLAVGIVGFLCFLILTFLHLG